MLEVIGKQWDVALGRLKTFAESIWSPILPDSVGLPVIDRPDKHHCFHKLSILKLGLGRMVSPISTLPLGRHALGVPYES